MILAASNPPDKFRWQENSLTKISALVRWLLVLLPVAAIIACNVLWTVITRPTNGYAEVRNQTGATISEITIAVCKSHFYFRDLPDNSRVGFSIPINCDSAYEIDAHLASGKKIQTKVGYVAHGLASSDALTIRENEVDLTSLPANH